MLGIALLVFREVLEAALIVTVVAAATRGVPGRKRFIGGGIALGVIGAIVGGFIASFLGIGGVTGVNIGSIIIAVIGAVVLLLVYRAVASRA